LILYPEFYTKVPSIVTYDPLSDFLGAFKDGRVEVSYLECVKLAGHSCPTVAGAYLMAQKGLEALYPNSIPIRGEIKVELQAKEEEGVAGVIGSVISFIVGASGVGGFKGIRGNFSRKNLLHYNVPMPAEVKLTRVDTQTSVELSYDPSIVKPDEKMKIYMKQSLDNPENKEAKEMFAALWQKRVEKILLGTKLHEQIITIKKDI